MLKHQDMAHLTISVWLFKIFLPCTDKLGTASYLFPSCLFQDIERDIWEYFTRFSTSINIQWDWVTRIDLHIFHLCRTCKEWGYIVLISSFDSEKSWLSEPWASVAPHPPELILNHLLRHIQSFEHSHRFTESFSHGHSCHEFLLMYHLIETAIGFLNILHCCELSKCDKLSKGSKFWEIFLYYH